MKSRVQLSPLARPLFAAFGIAAASVLSAQAQNLILNPGFEGPPAPTAKVTWGYSGGNGSQYDVPDWFTPGGIAPTDTGEETGGPSGKDGAWAAYLQSGNTGTSGYAAQTTSYVIQSGDTFTLSLLGSPGFTFNNTNGFLHYDLYYGGDSTTMGTVFGQGDIDLGPNGSGYQTFTVAGTAAPLGAVGQVLGVAFYNSSGTSPGGSGGTGSWIYVDDVSLTVTAVPEPSATAAVVACGLGLGILLRRRQRAASRS